MIRNYVGCNKSTSILEVIAYSVQDQILAFRAAKQSLAQHERYIYRVIKCMPHNFILIENEFSSGPVLVSIDQYFKLSNINFMDELFVGNQFRVLSLGSTDKENVNEACLHLMVTEFEARRVVKIIPLDVVLREYYYKKNKNIINYFTSLFICSSCLSLPHPYLK